MSLTTTSLILLLALCFSGCKSSVSQEARPLDDSTKGCYEVRTTERICVDGSFEDFKILWQHYEGNAWTTTSETSLSLLLNQASTLQSTPQVFSSKGTTESFFRTGSVGYHSQLFYDREFHLLFYHVRCDHPGELSLRARMDQSAIHGLNTLNGPIHLTHGRGSTLLIPFESAVSRGDNCLEILGEGELLVVMSCQQESVGKLWQQACRRFDPEGAPHYDVYRVATALIERAKLQSSAKP